MDDLKLQCLLKPRLYKDLIDAYAEKQMPAEAGLANILDRLHGVVGNASLIAAKVFYKNAKALKVLDDNNVLRLGGYISFEEDKNGGGDTQEQSNQAIIIQPPPGNKDPLQLPPPSAAKEIPIFLKGKGGAKLILPENFDNADLKRIVKVLKAYYEDDTE